MSVIVTFLTYIVATKAFIAILTFSQPLRVILVVNCRAQLVHSDREIYSSKPRDEEGTPHD